MGGGKVRDQGTLIPDYGQRRRMLLALLGLGLGALLWSAVGRQIVQKDYLQVQGERRYLRELSIPAHRGRISDRNGEPLALSSPMVSVWADPRHLPASSGLLVPLSSLIGIPLDGLRSRLENNSKKGFVYLQQSLPPEVGERVLSLLDRYHVGSLGLEHEYHRYYPSGEVTAHIIGLADDRGRGQEGMEYAYDKGLTGKSGLRRVIQDGRRRIVEDVELIRAPEQGRPLVLSLDRRLQFLAYRELKRAVNRHHAKAGTAVVLDVLTGEVLAMVNQPSFNPNDRKKLTPAVMRNRAITDLFEPGSTLKPLAVAAVLEAGKATPDTPVDTHPGYLRVGHHLVRDIHSYGLLTVTSVLTKSSNVGVTKLALELEPAYMWRVYDRFGIGHMTEVRFPGEVAGLLPPASSWSSFEQATHAFGYGLSMSALQLATAYAVLAADGVHRPVSLLKVDQAPQGERVVSAATARAVRRMLETVISNKGTAKRAAVEGYRVAGKTGTVKKAVAGGYAQHRYLSMFAGMIPASRPRLVMVVMIDEPQGKDYYGGVVAAPVFAAVMVGAMRLFNVAPDGELMETSPPRLARVEGRP
jgi:cell division protein FtsI (penicillin-binding protein 3)